MCAVVEGASILQPGGQVTRLAWRPGQPTAGEQVQVDVKDGLAGLPIRIENGPVTPLVKPVLFRQRGRAPK